MTGGGHARVLVVTGANGLLGRHLCRHFKRRGWEVRGLVRNPDASPLAEAGVGLFGCDLPDFLEEEALAGAQVLIHCAYTTRFTTLAAARRVNEEGTARVLAAARRADIERFVFISSTSAHAAARSYYGRSKHALEGWLDPERDLVVRPGLVLAAEGGLFQRMQMMVDGRRVIPLPGGGRQVLQTVHVEDLCVAVERALELELTGVVTVAEPEGIPLRELLRLATERPGRRCRVVPVPLAPVLLALRLIEALRLPFPVSSENLLGLAGIRPVAAAADMARLGVRLRSARESLVSLRADPPLR